MVKLRGDEARLVLENHDRNLRSIALSFKSGVEGDKTRATSVMREEVFTGMWKFSEVRDAMKKEVADLAGYYINELPKPPDFSIRIIRLSLAMFVLDKFDDMRKSVAKKPNVSLVALFEVARESAERLLGDKFFSLTQDELMHAYLDAEPSLVSLAKCCSIQMPNLHQAVEKYKVKAAGEIQQAVDDAA
jgi:hypothetical protein